MAKVQLRNINPLGCVDLPLIGRQGPANDEPGTGCLIPDEVFEVDEEHAGYAPHWRPATEEDKALIDVAEFRAVLDDEGNPEDLEIYDLGRGLLAQVGNYELVEREKPLEERTIPQLKKLAKDRGVDIGDATEKADIIAAIEKGA